MSTIEWIKITISLGGLIVSAGLLRWANSRYKHWKKNKQQASTLIMQSHATMMKEISAIKHEVQPNGGHSLNDKITQMADRFTGLENSISHLQVSMKNSRDIMEIASWESDENGRVTYVSLALCEMLGAGKESLIDNSWTGLLIPEDRARIYERWIESVETASTFNEHYSFRKPDGFLLKVNGLAIHNKDKNGKVINSLGRLIRIGEPFKK